MIFRFHGVLLAHSQVTLRQIAPGSMPEFRSLPVLAADDAVHGAPSQGEGLAAVPDADLSHCRAVPAWSRCGYWCTCDTATTVTGKPLRIPKAPDANPERPTASNAS